MRFIRSQQMMAAQNNSTASIPPHIQSQSTTADYILAPCVRTMGNIVSGTDVQTDAVVNAGFFDVIEICVSHHVRNVRKESCWALSNVVAGTQEQLEKFFSRHALVKKIVELSLSGDSNVRKEAGWCLSNAICGASAQQVEQLVQCGFIDSMVGMLEIGKHFFHFFLFLFFTVLFSNRSGESDKNGN